MRKKLYFILSAASALMTFQSVAASDSELIPKGSNYHYGYFYTNRESTIPAAVGEVYSPVLFRAQTASDEVYGWLIQYPVKDIVLKDSGVYVVSFSVTFYEGNDVKFGLMLNDTLISSSVYGTSGTDTVQATVIVVSPEKDGLLELVNVGSTDVNLKLIPGTPANMTGSLTVHKISSL